MSWNDINDPDKIYVGQKIIIKKTNTKLRDNLEFASGVAGLTCSTTQFTGALLYNYHMRALFNSNFEMMRYNNLNVAIDNGGKIWRGTNNSQFFNKALTQNIQNPTRYFPKAVPCLKLGGKIFGGAGLYFSYRRGYDAIQKNDMLTMIDAEMDFLMGCVGFIPYGGWITSGLYFLCKPAIRFNAEHVVERQIELGILGMAATMASK